VTLVYYSAFLRTMRVQHQKVEPANWASLPNILAMGCKCSAFSYPGPKFTDDLRTILRQFSDLRQSYDNWRIHRTFTTILRPILRRNLTITF